jgi:hypothetical protein
MMIATIAVGWLVLTLVMLISWSRLHAAGRASEGIDELLYINGEDAASLAEAA